MTDLARRMRAYARRHQLWTQRNAVLVALSGGPDSVALLHLISELRDQDELQVGAAHMNFGLRSDESDGDAEFCRRLCKNLDVPLYEQRPAAAMRGNTQDWARRERYAMFHRLRDREGYDRVATGHTSDDRAETLIIQLFRGAGMDALANMAPSSGDLIRPLLPVSRQDVRTYLRQRRLTFRVDRSNESSAYRRNRVRSELLPLAADIFDTDVARSLVGEADMLSLAGDYIERSAATLEAMTQRVPEGLRISLDALSAHHPVLRVAALRKMAAELGATPGREQSLRLLELVGAGPGRRVELGQGVAAERGRTDVWLLKHIAPLPAVVVNLSGVVNLPDGSSVEVRPAEPAPPYPDGRSRARMTLPDPSGELVVRRARPGDRMRPFGMRGSRLVFDLLSEAGVPSQRREHSWVLASDETIYWLLGVRQSESGRVTPGARPVYEFTWMAEE